jgi:hypothetical protein
MTIIRKSKLHKMQCARAVSLAGLIIFAGMAQGQELLTKPAWLPQLSLGAGESYDDNIFGVSGHGMPPQEAWITKISPGIGVDFAPLLGAQSPFQTLLVNYTPDFFIFALPRNKAPYDEPSQSYEAHKFGTVLKGMTGDFSFSVDNSFLYNAGNKTAPTYALNQTGAAGELDKYRSYFASATDRERLNQIDDRNTTILQYDVDNFFIRGAESLLYYNMDTIWRNNAAGKGYVGYQNYVDRSDVNGGLDLGYKVVTNVAVTLGYRYGSQYQQQFPTSITTDSHYSSSAYQRALLGLEGQPRRWLDVKLAGGPDFRDYNPNTPVTDFHPIKYYGEAAIKATIVTGQSLTFNYKQWNWLSPVGFVPEFDSSYALAYHWSATSRLGFDLVGKIQEVDYTDSDDFAGTAPSLRDDRMYMISPSVTYAFTPQLSASLSYTYNAANNELYTLPAADQASYRNYIDNVVFLGLLYKF